jgi:hypothetical protein
MRFQIGAMSAGDILDRGIKLLFARLPTFFVITFIVQFPVLVFQVVFVLLFQKNSMLALLGASYGALLLQAVLHSVGVAAILHVVAQEFIDRRAGVAEAFTAVLSRLGSILLGTFLYGLILIAGWFLCCIPFFIFVSWFCMFSQAIMVEGTPATESLTRSKQLSEGYKLRILGIWLLMFVVIPVVLGLGVGLVLAVFFPSTEIVETATGPAINFNMRNLIINQVLAFPVSALELSYSSVCMTLLYFDLRIRKEGFDLEIAAQRLASHDETEPLE